MTETGKHTPAAAPDMREALQSLYSFVALMVGRGPDAVIPETITTPIGVPVKIGAIMRDAELALAKTGATPVTETAKQIVLSKAQLPPPDALIEYDNGTVCAVMFQYALEYHDIREIARENGFDIRGRDLDEQDDADLYRRYFDDGQGEEVLRDWQPTPPDGWMLAGKWDTDDGPMAWFVRRTPEATP